MKEPLMVSTGDGVLEITKVKSPALGKVEASKFMAQSDAERGKQFQ